MTTRTNLSANDAYNSSGPSACPSMVSGSSVVEPSHPLTRKSSSFDGHPGANMMRFVSSQSWQTDGLSSQDAVFSSAAAAGVRGEVLGLRPGLLGARDRLPAGHAPELPVVGPDAQHQPVHAAASVGGVGIDRAVDVERERGERQVERLEPGAPLQGGLPAGPPEQQPKHHRTEAAGRCGARPGRQGVEPSKREGKLALQKTPYQRPKHPRVYCNQCDDHPDGFRGDHELRRHLNSKHKGIVKTFVCRDPATVGMASKVKVLYPLAECRACASKKQYGAYYSAATYLRRTHFKPRAARGKNKGPSEEKRGGKGSGDWPPMADLKLWYEEVLVASDGSAALDDVYDGGDDETPDNADDVPMNIFPDLDGGSATTASSLDMDSGAYNMSLPGTMDGPRLQDAGGGIAMSTADMASSVSAPMGYLAYGTMSFADGSTPEYALSAAASSASDTVTPDSFCDPNPHVISDYLWSIEDVEV